jgi:hypothetical protein
MRPLLCALVLVAACKHEQKAEPSPRPPVKSYADPAGPCAVMPHDNKCDKIEAHYLAAERAATRVELAVGATKSEKLAASPLAARLLPLHKGDHVRLHVLSSGPGKPKLEIRRWWLAADGWGVASDEYEPAVPGASYEQEWLAEVDGDQLVAVEVDPPGELELTLTR